LKIDFEPIWQPKTRIMNLQLKHFDKEFLLCDIFHTNVSILHEDHKTTVQNIKNLLHYISKHRSLHDGFPTKFIESEKYCVHSSSLKRFIKDKVITEQILNALVFAHLNVIEQTHQRILHTFTFDHLKNIQEEFPLKNF